MNILPAFHFRVLNILTVLCLIGLSACGGGSGSGSVPDTTAPTAVIQFPPVQSLSNVDSMTVRGTSSDAGTGVAVVRVNGVDATTDDGYATWRVDVTLTPGDNALIVETTDIANNSNMAAAQVNVLFQEVDFDNGFDVALDSTNNRAIVLDRSKLIAVNLSTGVRTLISGADRGTGDVFQNLRGIVLDTANNRALVVDDVLNALMAVALDTGNRTIISNASQGMGDTLTAPRDIVLNPSDNGLAFVVGDTPSVLMEVDLSSGDREVVSGNMVGTGDNFNFAEGLAIDSANSRALVIDSGNGQEALFAVDLSQGMTRGNRTIISNVSNGTGPNFGRPSHLVFDASGNRVFVSDFDFGLDTVFSVNLTSGNRTILSDATTGEGEILQGPRGMAFDATNDRLYISDIDIDALLSIDVTAGMTLGDRTVVSRNGVGAGESLDNPQGLALNTVNNQLLVADSGTDAYYAIDLSSGDRTVLSDDTVGTGSAPMNPQGIVFDAVNNRALAIDAYLESIFAIDLTNGNRTLVSGAMTGSGDAFDGLSDITLDLPNNRALVVTGGSGSASVYAVDLTTGNRTLLSGGMMGSGVEFDDPESILYDATNNRVIVGDSNLEALVTVDLNTGPTLGNRSTLSDAMTGTGDDLGSPNGLVLDSENNRILVSDSGDDLVLAVDLTAGLSLGNRTALSSDTVGAGRDLVSPSGIVYNASSNTALIADRSLDAIVAVDLVSGQRVIVSQ